MGSKKALGLDIGTNSIGWVLKEWHEVLSIINGKNQKAVENPDGEYPIYGSGGIMNYADEYLCPENSTIVGRKGTINKPILVREKFWNVDTAFGLVAGEELDSFYLNYFCQSFDFSTLNKSTTLPSLAKRDLNEIKIPLPPLPEQQRIVAKLDGVFANIDQAIGLLEENIAHTQALMGSVLDEEFGNSKSKSKQIKDLVVKTKTLSPKVEFSKNEFTYIDITSVNKNLFIIENPKILTGLEAPSRARKVVEKGDIVFATTRPNLKNIAIVSQEYNNPIASTGFCLLRTKVELLNYEYLFYFLISEKVQELILPFIKGAQYPAISDKDLLSLEIPLQTLKEQKETVHRIKSMFSNLNKLTHSQTQKLNHLKSLKSSLLDQAFKGEL